MKLFVCLTLAAMVATSMATIPIAGTTLLRSDLGVLGGLGGINTIGGYGLGLRTLGYNSLLGQPLISRGIVQPIGLGLGYGSLGLRADSLIVPQKRIIASPLIGSSLIGSPLIGSRLIGSPLIGSSLIGSRIIGSPLIGSSLIGSPIISKSIIPQTTLLL